MMDLNFEHTAVLHALDQDSVQNLVSTGVQDWGLTREQALLQVKAWAVEGLFRCYEDGKEAGLYCDVAASMLSLDYLDAHPYTWMEPTERTFERWNGIWAEHNGASALASKEGESDR
jgi:hypothetical protein